MNGFVNPRLPLALTRHADWVDNTGDDFAAGRSILCYGVRIGIQTNAPEILERVIDHGPPLWKPAATPLVERLFFFQIGHSRSRRIGRHVLFDSLEPAVRGNRLEELLGVFETRVKMFVAERARRRVFVHAGAVGWRGKAIILAGRTFTGKTSLTAELVRQGALYHSDEYAVLDTLGRVHPYPQPLAVRDNSSYIQARVPVEQIGGQAGTGPLPVGMVVVAQYKAGHSWRPTRISAGQALLELLSNTVPARRKPEVVMPTLARAVSHAISLKGVRGEAAETVKLILERWSPS